MLYIRITIILQVFCLVTCVCVHSLDCVRGAFLITCSRKASVTGRGSYYLGGGDVRAA